MNLIENKLYPFADEGPLVFDGRTAVENNEFPIRFYDHEYGGSLDGLSENPFEVIPDFFQIEPEGAGKTGIDYWLGWVSMEKWNFEE